MHPSLLPPPSPTDRRAAIQVLSPGDGPTAVEPLDPLLLADIAAGLAHAVRTGGAVASGRILQTNRYDAWVVHVAPGCDWTVDAARGTGAVHLVTGVLTEEWVTERDAAAPTPARRRLAPGDTFQVRAAHRRRVSNDTPTEAVAVFVSSPPAGTSLPVGDCGDHLRMVS